MDTRLLVQRTREFFGDQLADLVACVRQDREALRGWQEPRHIRSALRSAASAAAQAGGPALTMTQTALARQAGEPDAGAQREALGQILDAGACALEMLAGQGYPDLSQEQQLGLTCVALIYGRPCVQVSEGRLGDVPGPWSGMLEDQRELIEMNQSGVGRIELVGHPEYEWAATGFLVSETCLLTTRRTAEIFTERLPEGRWQFRPGISGWMNFRGQVEQPASAAYRLQRVLGVHDRYDVALFEVEPSQSGTQCPNPLMIAQEPPRGLEGRPVYLVGYPARDSRRDEPEAVARIFRDVYNTKRVQPGTLRGSLHFNGIELLRHDCGLLGQSMGSCVVDLETQQVLGLHVSGRYMDAGTAIPLWRLTDDPLFRSCGVKFTRYTPQEEVDRVTAQVERLAHSRYWTELEAAVADLYRRAFGNVNGTHPG